MMLQPLCACTLRPPAMVIFTKRRLAWTKALDVPQYLATAVAT